MKVLLCELDVREVPYYVIPCLHVQINVNVNGYVEDCSDIWSEIAGYTSYERRRHLQQWCDIYLLGENFKYDTTDIFLTFSQQFIFYVKRLKDVFKGRTRSTTLVAKYHCNYSHNSSSSRRHFQCTIGFNVVYAQHQISYAFVKKINC